MEGLPRKLPPWRQPFYLVCCQDGDFKMEIMDTQNFMAGVLAALIPSMLFVAWLIWRASVTE